MATYRHPVTGVELNEITIRRTKPSAGAERKTVLLLAAAGETEHIIAAMFGTNQGRIADILGEEKGKGVGKGKSRKPDDQPDLF